MKRAIWFILLFTFYKSYSQGFLPYHKERPAYYQFGSYDVFYQQAAIAIDSFKLNGIDTVFFHSSIIDWDNSINGCYLKAHDTSFLSITSIRTSTNDDFFFNRNNDSIYFNNSASLNQNWELYRFANGDVIKATVQSIDEVSVLGVNDSVKTIKLQAQNSGGNNISNIFNGKIFRVGKATGFVNGYSLFHFPEDTIGFSIVGIENPPQGLNTSELSLEKIFDFEVGDEFDYRGFYTIVPTTFQYTCRIMKILTKEVLAGGDTLRYTGNQTYFEKTYSWGDSTFFGSSVIFTQDYVLSEYEYLNHRPFEYSSTLFGDQGYSYLVPSNYSLDASVKLFHYPQFYLVNDDCLSGIPASFYPDVKYAKGLGRASFYAYSYPNYFWDTLAYFNKNGVEWGTPVSCPVWTGGNDPIFSDSDFHVDPNPSADQLFLSGNFSSQTEIHMLNLLGEEMKVMILATSSQGMNLNISDLPNGVYLLKIQSEEKIFTKKIIKN